MEKEIDYIIDNIDFSLRMENLPLTEKDKSRLRDCLTGKIDPQKALQQILSQYVTAEA
jgi:hypothetical protein